ncbi:serine hydrolase domain-containing protein [uncultured Erythrobacter sp.]|uniref:serine hydrolase domain-containing protein n=1 Tax=uncultured Erythrobacter sp. TaxID=263913 RepID=UPI00260E8607|nr:serine hydrolase domain-containing protein [uncultured Erythrobacter sp.]
MLGRIIAAIWLSLAMVLGSIGTVQALTVAISLNAQSDLEASGVPGMAYGYVHEEPLDWFELGVKRKGIDDPVTSETPFIIGSVSKSFTALAIMQLVEAGKLDLEAPLETYLEGFAGKQAGQATIAQLLSHTSGYSMLQGNEAQADLTQDADALARRVRGLAEITPANRPGEVWAYSNANYQILGRVIEIVSGKPFDIYMTEEVLVPAGMADSYVFDGERRPEAATGHRPFFFGKIANDESLTGRGSGPQGGIVATAKDMATYLALMMNGEDDFLSAEGKAMMMRPASEASPNYGFGWFLDSEQGLVFHSGANPGFEALATMRPSDRRAVVVLTNAGSGMAFGQTTELRNRVTAHYLDLPYSGESTSWGMIAGFLILALLPVIYLASMIWAWRKRTDLRAKSGAFGLFSLWFPLLSTGAAAWALLSLVPSLFGAPLSAIRLFQPDVGLAMIASAVLGVVWAVFRLSLAYSRKQGR